MAGPDLHADADALAEAIVGRVGTTVNLALPLGLGKSAGLANALYRMARAEPALELNIYTALTLERPRASSALEARLLDPLIDRLYAGVPELAYAADFRLGRLPPNVSVVEFYLRPGVYLGSPAAQQAYSSINYTHAARDLARRGVNVIAQLVAPSPGDDRSRYSLSCNPDVTLDLIDAALAAGCLPCRRR